jgi:hypothetical protein
MLGASRQENLTRINQAHFPLSHYDDGGEVMLLALILLAQVAPGPLVVQRNPGSDLRSSQKIGLFPYDYNLARAFGQQATPGLIISFSADHQFHLVPPPTIEPTRYVATPGLKIFLDKLEEHSTPPAKPEPAPAKKKTEKK